VGDIASSGAESRHEHGFLARIAWWLALLVLIALAVPMLARLIGFESGVFAALVAFVPLFTVALLVPAAVFLVIRSWWPAVASLAVMALGVIWLVPLFTAADAEGETALTVAAVNVKFGQADADQVVALARDSQVDLLVITELTPDSERALHTAGLDDLLPHSEVHALDGPRGTGLWSRYPLESAALLDQFVSATIEARVVTPEGTITAFAVHPPAPGPRSHPRWAADLERLHAVLEEAAGPVVVIGDFNTTRDHRAFRDIEALGYMDAADEAGAGFQPTFPQGRGSPPLVAIDHALTRDTPWIATGFERHVIERSDHQVIVVTYADR